MITNNRLNELPETFKRGKFHDNLIITTHTWQEPNILRCFVHKDELNGYCVVKGYYEDIERVAYTIHLLETIPIIKWFKEVGTELYWGKSFMWNNTKEQVIHDYAAYLNAKKEKRDRQDEQIKTFYDESLDK